MQVLLTHARKDDELARQLADRLQRNGLTVWSYQDQISAGENWAKKLGRALDDSELMVILLTPRAMDSDLVRQSIEFALTSKKYAGRVFSVFVGPTVGVPKDMPWILLKLPHCQVQSAADFDEVVKAIRELAGVSHSNA